MELSNSFQGMQKWVCCNDREVWGIMKLASVKCSFSYFVGKKNLSVIKETILVP